MPPTTLADAIRAMISFFEGFEYGGTAIVMTHGDYLHHKPEFTCDSIQNFSCPFPAYSKEVDQTILKDACISYVWAHLYLGHKSGYAWHISDVKVYDKPMIPEDFRYYACTDRVKTAPQSFMYVNELEEI